MSAKNIYHNTVVRALEADGWTITDDPLKVGYGGRNLEIDLGAERAVIGAKRGAEKIAVEIQSFLNESPVRDLEEAIGQFDLYRVLLAETKSVRQLYMAVPQRVWASILSEPLGRLAAARLRLQFVVFSEDEDKVIQWIRSSDIDRLFEI